MLFPLPGGKGGIPGVFKKYRSMIIGCLFQCVVQSSFIDFHVISVGAWTCDSGSRGTPFRLLTLDYTFISLLIRVKLHRFSCKTCRGVDL